MRKASVELRSSPEDIKQSLLGREEYAINSSQRGSKFSARKLSSVSAEDEEFLDRANSMYAYN